MIDLHWQRTLKFKLIENVIPKRLFDTIKFSSLEKVNILNQSSNRAMLLLRYICEKQMTNVHNIYDIGNGPSFEDDEENFTNKVDYLKLMINICIKIVFFIDNSQRIAICLSNMSVGQYLKSTGEEYAHKHYSQLDAINQEMAKIIEKLKNENISLKFDLTVLDAQIRKVQELKHIVQKIFVEKSPEELK